ncbi:hypothetical protein CISG_07783 [Coccidioides immitis RMSCC 3703]|uniref:Uncharacterized protein n=1 Tax=Coccidioides immitis RMSCC 3703 TaxID=454286 RepID=A0A0J8R2K1_COCIT|nr:hypothetical protein CISG_07783 [Coccidioides immitis RMSCC 3703]
MCVVRIVMILVERRGKPRTIHEQESRKRATSGDWEEQGSSDQGSLRPAEAAACLSLGFFQRFSPLTRYTNRNLSSARREARLGAVAEWGRLFMSPLPFGPAQFHGTKSVPASRSPGTRLARNSPGFDFGFVGREGNYLSSFAESEADRYYQGNTEEERKIKWREKAVGRGGMTAHCMAGR